MRCQRCFTSSSIGAKVVVAITGLLMVGFVLAHMVGNLQVFLGQEVYNAYAHMLQSLGGLLWVARIGLLAAVAAHIYFTIKLNLANKAARPVAYQTKKWTRASLQSRTMVLSGLVVLFFVLYHLAHFTLGITDPSYKELVDAAGRHDVYAMFIKGFSNPLVAGLYMVANVLLALHLSHGVSSVFQTLGVSHPKYTPLLNKLGPALAVVVAAGNVVMPLAVQLGFLTLPVGVA